MQPQIAGFVSVFPLFRRIFRSVRHADVMHFDITLAVDAHREVGTARERTIWELLSPEIQTSGRAALPHIISSPTHHTAIGL